MAEDGSRADGSAGDSGQRDVPVPMSVYKIVTVFSTLFAVLFVLLGFVLLDTATNRASLPLAQVDPIVAILGLMSILAGAAIYAYSTRFRAEGMGKDKPDTNEANIDE